MFNEDFKKYGNYLGICIENRDPEYRGRVKIFIPHIMPDLQENWNDSGFDITIDCVGNNLQNGLDSSIIDKLRSILPWSECASPVFGTSTAGSFNPVSGTYNQTNYTENSNAALTPSSANFKIDENIDENLARYTMSIGARETSFDTSEANSDYYNSTVTIPGKNGSYYNSNVARGVNKEDLTLEQSRAKYGDYGYFQTNQNDVEHAVRLGVPRDIASAMNNGGGRGNYTPEQQARATALYIKAYRPEAAAAASRGDYTTANALLKGKWPSLPGGRSHKTGQDSKANAFLSGSKQAPNINQPASNPDPSSLTAPPMPQSTAEGGDYTTNSQVPSDGVNVSTTISGGGQGIAGTVSGKSTTSRPGFANAFKSNVLKGASGLKSASGTTLCGQGTRKAVGLALGDSYYSNTGFGTDITADTVRNGYWTKKGDYANGGTVGSDYKPQQGDVLVHQKNKGGTAYGHAQVYLDGQWHSWKSGDDVQGYLNKSGQTTTVMRLTEQGKQKLASAGVADASLLGKDGSVLAAASARANDENNGIEGDYNSNISKHTTSTQATPLDTTGMAQGLFSVPNPGALLWVFFREGNPLFPVYFAASYGAAEWASVYTQQSPPLYYPKENDISTINNEATLRPNSCGAIKFNGTVTDEKDYRSIKIAHANGGFHELHATGTIHYSPNEHVEQIGGNRFSYCLNKEEWVQGTDNRVTIGDQYIVVGTPTQANIKVIEELTQKVKKINEEMLKD